MSHFIGTMLGLGIEEKDEALAKQLLKCIGADPDGEDMYDPRRTQSLCFRHFVCG